MVLETPQQGQADVAAERREPASPDPPPARALEFGEAGAARRLAQGGLAHQISVGGAQLVVDLQASQPGFGFRGQLPDNRRRVQQIQGPRQPIALAGDGIDFQAELAQVVDHPPHRRAAQAQGLGQPRAGMETAVGEQA